MKFFGDISIKQKIMRIILLGCAVALLLSYLAIIINEAIQFQREVKQEIMTLANIIGNNISTAILSNDRKAASKTLSVLRNKPDILAAYIIVNDDTVFSEYLAYNADKKSLRLEKEFEGNHSISAKKALSNFKKENESFFDFDGEIGVVSNIIVDNRPIGKVIIQADESHFAAKGGDRQGAYRPRSRGPARAGRRVAPPSP